MIPTFKFGNIHLEQVAKKLLHDKASTAMYSLIQKGRRLNLPTYIMLKLVDSCVEPILLYGCEVWVYENIDILEKVHTKFCKFIFGVSKYSHNMPLYGELGRYPLSIKIKQNGSLLDENIKSGEYKRSCKQFYITFTVKLYVSSIFQNSGSNYVWLT